MCSDSNNLLINGEEAMKRNILIVYIIAFLALIFGCKTTLVNVYKVDDTLNNNFPKSSGVFYHLPRTVLHVNMTVEQQTKSPGLYYPRTSEYTLHQQLNSDDIFVYHLKYEHGGKDFNDHYENGLTFEFIEERKKAVDPILKKEGKKLSIDDVNALASLGLNYIPGKTLSKNDVETIKNHILLMPDDKLNDYGKTVFNQLIKDKGFLTDDQYKNLLKILETSPSDDRIIRRKQNTFKFKCNITSSSENDPEEQYFVEIQSDSFTARNLELTLTELGSISSSSVKSTDKRLDIAVSALDTVASLVGKIIPLAAGIHMEFIDKHVLHELAMKDAEKLKNLQTNYNKFILMQVIGAAPDNLEVYEKVKDEFEKQIASLEEKFLGQNKKTEKELKATVLLKEIPKNPLLLFKYNHLGLFDFNSDYVEEPKPFDVTKIVHKLQEECGKNNESSQSDQKKCILEGKAISIIIEDLADKHHGLDKIKKVFAYQGDPNEPHGLTYRIPGRVKLKIKNGSSILSQDIITVAQFGVTGFLPREIKTIQGGTKIEYYNDSGAIKTIAVNSDTFDSANLKTIGGSVEKVLTATDELTRKKRELDLLDTELSLNVA